MSRLAAAAAAAGVGEEGMEDGEETSLRLDSGEEREMCAAAAAAASAAPSSSQTCKVLDCAVAPVVHIIMENRSKAPKAIRMAPEGAPNPQGLALYVITEEIIVSLPALTHRQRGMIKSRGGLRQDVDWTPSSHSALDPEPPQEEEREEGERERGASS